MIDWWGEDASSEAMSSLSYSSRARQRGSGSLWQCSTSESTADKYSCTTPAERTEGTSGRQKHYNAVKAANSNYIHCLTFVCWQFVPRFQSCRNHRAEGERLDNEVFTQSWPKLLHLAFISLHYDVQHVQNVYKRSSDTGKQLHKLWAEILLLIFGFLPSMCEMGILTASPSWLLRLACR